MSDNASDSPLQRLGEKVTVHMREDGPDRPAIIEAAQEHFSPRAPCRVSSWLQAQPEVGGASEGTHTGDEWEMLSPGGVSQCGSSPKSVSVADSADHSDKQQHAEALEQVVVTLTASDGDTSAKATLTTIPSKPPPSDQGSVKAESEYGAVVERSTAEMATSTPAYIAHNMTDSDQESVTEGVHIEISSDPVVHGEEVAMETEGLEGEEENMGARFFTAEEMAADRSEHSGHFSPPPSHTSALEIATDVTPSAPSELPASVAAVEMHSDNPLNDAMSENSDGFVLTHAEDGAPPPLNPSEHHMEETHSPAASPMHGSVASLNSMGELTGESLEATSSEEAAMLMAAASLHHDFPHETLREVTPEEEMGASVEETLPAPAGTQGAPPVVPSVLRSTLDQLSGGSAAAANRVWEWLWETAAQWGATLQDFVPYHMRPYLTFSAMSDGLAGARSKFKQIDWTTAAMGASIAVLGALLVSLYYQNRRLAHNLRIKEREMGQLVIKVLKVQSSLQGIRRIPLIRHTSTMTTCPITTFHPAAVL